jgi:hypothetical protein
MWLRHEDALATTIAADLGLPEPSTACRAFARFVLGVYPLSREAANPAAAVDEIFDLISPGWDDAVTNGLLPAEAMAGPCAGSRTERQSSKDGESAIADL